MSRYVLLATGIVARLREGTYRLRWTHVQRGRFVFHFGGNPEDPDGFPGFLLSENRKTSKVSSVRSAGRGAMVRRRDLPGVQMKIDSNVPVADATMWLTVHGKRFPVRDLADASARFQKFRGSRGIRFFPVDPLVIDVHGIPIARISYNGRVWAPGEWKSGDNPILEADGEPFDPARGDELRARREELIHDDHATMSAQVEKAMVGMATRAAERLEGKVYEILTKPSTQTDPQSPTTSEETMSSKKKNVKKAKSTKAPTKAVAPKKEKRANGVKGPTQIVRELREKNPKATFTEICRMAVTRGVNKNTAQGAMVRITKEAKSR